MPIDFRRDLSTPINKCPPSMEMRLRDPKCRNEMKDRPHKNPHDEPKPKPPKPDPPDPKPKPPRPSPKPQPNPKPNFDAPRPIPYQTSSSMPVSATGMALGGAGAGLLYGAGVSNNLANITRGYRQLGEVRATPAEPVEDIQFAEPAETEMADITPKAPEGLRTTSLDADFFQQGESLETGADVAEESGTVARTAPEGLRTTSLDADFFKTSGQVAEPSELPSATDTDFAPDFKDFSSGFQEQAEEGLGKVGVGEGASSAEGGIEMGELGGEALAEGAGEATAEIGGELATEASVAGEETAGTGGAGAIIGAGIMVVGAGVAVGQLIGSAVSAHDTYVKNEFNNMENTQVLSNTELQSMIGELNVKAYNTTDAKQRNAIKKQVKQLEDVQSSNQQAVVYTDKNGNKQIAFTLSNADLAKAIKTYQQNPNAFKGLSPDQLEIMGLNPDMSKGKSGAKGYEKNGFYTPKGSYFTNNIANNYVASNRKGDIQGQKGIDEGFNQAIKPQAQKAYEAQFEEQIDKATNSTQKEILKAQYNIWRANNGLDSYGASQEIAKLNKKFKEDKITQEQYDALVKPITDSFQATKKYDLSDDYKENLQNLQAQYANEIKGTSTTDASTTSATSSSQSQNNPNPSTTKPAGVFDKQTVKAQQQQNLQDLQTQQFQKYQNYLNERAEYQKQMNDYSLTFYQRQQAMGKLDSMPFMDKPKGFVPQPTTTTTQQNQTAPQQNQTAPQQNQQNQQNQNKNKNKNKNK